MADHAKPILTDNYTDVLSQIRGRLEDQAKGFDPANTTATNISTGTIRWTSASNKWQKWSGTSWADLSSLYAINISGNAATATNASTVTNGVYTVGDQTIAGVKTFSSTIQGSISGNAGTVTNGVYTTGDQTINGVKTFNSNTIFNGNLGLGVTPSAWFSTYKALQVSTNGSLATNTDFFAVSNNTFVNAAGNDIYLTTGFAGRYRHVASNGAHQWFTAPSGTAGSTISFTQAMTLDANGNLGIGTSSPSNQLDISKSTDPSASFYRTSNSPGVGIGRLIWDGQNSSGSRSTYARIQAEIVTNTAGSHTGQLIFSTTTGGALTNKMTLDANGKLILSAANQGIQFADGTTQTTAGINPATAAAGAIGTMAMCKYTGTGSVSFGGTKNASELQYSDVTGTIVTIPVEGNVWRCLGRCSDAGNTQRVTIWVRVS